MEKKKVFDFLDIVLNNRVCESLFVKLPEKTSEMFSLVEYITILGLLKFVTIKTHSLLLFFIYYFYLLLFTLFSARKIGNLIGYIAQKYIPPYESIIKGKVNFRFFVVLVVLFLFCVGLSFFLNRGIKTLIDLIMQSNS